MTILIGAVYENKAYMGADTLWTWDDNFVRSHTTSKFLELPVEGTNKVIIATAGQDKFTQILDRVLLSNPTLINFSDRKGLLRLIDDLQKEVKKAGIGDAENNQLPDHDLGFLIVTSASNKIWVVESDYGILEFEDYVCAGSGAFLGEAAMKALSKSNIFGGEAIKLALDTVCELHPYCGGKTEIKEIDLDITETSNS